MQKNLFKYTVLTAAAAIALAGCAKNVEPQQQMVADGSYFNKCYGNAPKWVLNGGEDIPGMLTSVGSAKIGAAGFSQARTEAMAQARNEMTRSLSVRVNNMVKNFVRSNGAGTDETVDRVSEDVSRQLASTTLSGTKQKDFWTSDVSCGNELYIEIIADAKDVQKDVKAQTISSFQNRNAQYQLAQSKDAQSELQKVIEDNFSGKDNTELAQVPQSVTDAQKQQ